MQVTLFADRSVLELAFKAADNIAAPGSLIGLRAPLDGANQARLSQAWVAIKEGLEAVYESGVESSRTVMDGVWQTVDQLIKDAGQAAQTLKDALLAKLAEWRRVVMDGLLRQVIGEITAADIKLKLNSVQISQKVALTGSLKASMTDAFALTSNAELQISASYGDSNGQTKGGGI
jgi:hypothetical protein